MPLNPPKPVTKSEQVGKTAHRVEGWLDDHADLIAMFLMGGILGYILGVN